MTRGETDDYRGIVRCLRAGKILQHLLNNRMPFLLEHLQRKHHIMCRERTAIVKRNSASQKETICQPVGRYLHPPRSKAVHGIRLVIGARHQACEGELHSLGGITLENKAIEGVEREYALIENPDGRNLRKHAAFRRFRIDILELVEVSWILEITKS